MVPVGDMPMLCFTPETRIATPRGEVRMRDLRVGHLVLCQGIGGAVQPITWIGKVQAEIARHPRPERVRPILIKAGALEDGVPARDLRVSPDHAILRGIVLVPARLLLNGVTILQEQDWPQITYYHLELPRHSVVIADGAPAESWLDDGRRAQFSNSGVTVRFVDFEGACASRGLTCYPVLRDERSTAPLRASLAARARDLGFQEVNEPDLRLRVGDIALKSHLAGPGRYVFRLNAEAASLAQRHGMSMTSRVSTETAAVGRQLGAALSGLMIRAGRLSISIGAGDPRLRSIRGLGAPEAAAARRARWPATLDGGGGAPAAHPAHRAAEGAARPRQRAGPRDRGLPCRAGSVLARRRGGPAGRVEEAPRPQPEGHGGPAATAHPIFLRAGALEPDDNPFRVVSLPSAPVLGRSEREEAERAG